ncbi:hypothetical protein [Aeromonas hydrophila]|uniref:hypothetical protein n=1 Tax=Aeromonas hydrophila TaxID=644 RepID=UPI00191D9942|nr:hypothetical protein [Aeromonas hydrophila]MBL0560415.1 hypothetical protein [Aeromonas hydrophila]
MSEATTPQGAVEMTVSELAQQVADRYRATWGDTFRDRGETLLLNSAAFPAAITVFVCGEDDDAQTATLMLQGMIAREGDGLSAFGQRFMEALLCWLARQVYQARVEAADTPPVSAQILRMEDYQS